MAFDGGQRPLMICCRRAWYSVASAGSALCPSMFAPRVTALGRDQAVRVWLASSRPSSVIEVSRILNFCTLPVTVNG